MSQEVQNHSMSFTLFNGYNSQSVAPEATVSSSETPDVALHHFAEKLSCELQVARILILEARGEHLELRASSGPLSNFPSVNLEQCLLFCQAALNKQAPVHIENLANDDIQAISTTGKSVMNGLALPIAGVEEPSGVLVALTGGRQHLQERQEQHLYQAAMQAAILLQHRRTLRLQRALDKIIESREQSENYLHLLQQIISITSPRHSFEQTVRMTLDRACHYLGWDAGHLYERASNHRKRFEDSGIWTTGTESTWPEAYDICKTIRLTPGVGMAGRAIMTRTPIRILCPEPRAHFPIEGAEATIGCALLSPILVNDRVVGVLELLSRQHREPDARVIAVVQQIGLLLGRSIERQYAEERALRHQRELAHTGRVALMGEMASSIAHEMNQPLSAIISYLGAARRLMDQNKLGEVREIIDEIAVQARRGGDTMQRLRQFVRKEEYQLELFEVNEIIRNARELTIATARMSNTDVRLDLAPMLPPIEGNPIQLEQVFINLILNAVEAMEQISDRQRLIIISTRPSDNSILITCKDNGNGIPPDMIERIFEPFFSGKTQGMGMGLSISRSIVESHGGQIWIQNEQGAAFYIRLPINATT